MKLEDITNQEALDAAIAEKVQASIKGLESKNSELLGKLKALKNDAGDVAELKKQAEELKTLKERTLEEQGEFKKLYEQSAKQHAETLAERDAKLSAADKTIHNLIVNEGLSKALAQNKINPVLLEPAVNLLSHDVVVVEEGGKLLAKVGDKGLNDYVLDWVSTDVGKNFTLASGNSGGGAGGNGRADTASEHAKHFMPDTWNLTEQAKLSKADPTLYTQLHEQHPTREAGGQQKA